ncbi:MAG: hypothetical protein ACOZNI_04170 [Myxococcota bacterium]
MSDATQSRKTWRKPALQRFGRVTDLTAGGSQATNESMTTPAERAKKRP